MATDMTATVGALVAAKLDSAVIPGLVQGTMTPGLIKLLSTGDSTPSPTKALITDQQPAAEFTSKALDVLLALASLRYADQGVALSGAGFKGYLGSLDADGGLASTGVAFTLANGIMIPVSLDAPDEGETTLQSLVFGRSADGAAAPVAIATAQALPTITAFNSYCAGTATVNGAAFDLVQRVRIDFNIGLKHMRGDGASYGKKIVRLTCRPVITITTLDVAVLATLTVAGARQGDTDSTIFLRRYDAAGNKIATNVANHIKISIQGNNSLFECASIRGSDAVEGASDVVINPVFDGTLPVITVAVSQTY